MVRLAVTLAAMSLASQVSAQPGAVTGTVIFEGEAPERKPLVRTTDAYCAKSRLSEDVVVTAGRLRDVVVRLKQAPRGATSGGDARGPVLIDQRDCMYTPRVVALVAGTKLVVRNSDGTFHNVRGTLAGKTLWNKPQPAKDPDLALDPSDAKAGDIVELACDVHPWMRASIAVIDHPHFAVTGEDGKFELRGLPAGKHTLVAWHPTLGTRTLDIQIGTGNKANVTARISYKQ